MRRTGKSASRTRAGGARARAGRQAAAAAAATTEMTAAQAKQAAKDEGLTLLQEAIDSGNYNEKVCESLNEKAKGVHRRTRTRMMT